MRATKLDAKFCIIVNSGGKYRTYYYKNFTAAFKKFSATADVDSVTFLKRQNNIMWDRIEYKERA